MDLSLITEGQAFRLQPESVHGMLWLQTHFEKDDWDALTSGAVTIAPHDAAMLVIDAEDAKLIVHYD